MIPVQNGTMKQKVANLTRSENEPQTTHLDPTKLVDVIAHSMGNISLRGTRGRAMEARDQKRKGTQGTAAEWRNFSEKVVISG